MNISSALNNKKYFYSFIFLVTLLSAFAVFGDKGIVDAYHLKEERDSIVNQNSGISEENLKLTEQIELLKNDKRYIARIVRKELGMIGPREVIYMIDK